MNRSHCQKLTRLFHSGEDAIVYIQGAQETNRHETDFVYPFRQESNFWYLTGINEPDFHFVLDLYDGTGHLFVPKRSVQYAVWHGIVRDADYYTKSAKPDAIHYDDELESFLKARKASAIYCLNDDQATPLKKWGLNTITESLKDALTDCRVIKMDDEIEQLRKAGQATSKAHIEVIKAIKPGMMEYEIKALFEYHCIRQGMQQQPYNGIYASGTNSAILHYVENTRQMLDGELFLIDAGGEWNGYAHDVTRTYPVNGRFSELQAGVYDAVLNAHLKSIDQAKPGVKMEDLHMMAARTIMDGLQQMDIVRGDLDAMMDHNVFALFFPHGLGHFLGLDTHDPGGYPKGVDRIQRPGIQYLRARRTLEPGMVVTIEPGCYFIPALLKPALQDGMVKPYLNQTLLESMFDFGGVRIEDDIVITSEGNENLTDIPKHRKDIESLMQS
jgi:Xaa-Pro dipeptidase